MAGTEERLVQAVEKLAEAHREIHGRQE